MKYRMNHHPFFSSEKKITNIYAFSETNFGFSFIIK